VCFRNNQKFPADVLIQNCTLLSELWIASLPGALNQRRPCKRIAATYPLPAAHRLADLVATPKPRLVKLTITSHGEDTLTTAGSRHRATHYVVKVELGGIAGVVAPLIGKQPQDTHVWILGGKAPAFVKMEGPLYQGAPIWRIELTSPVWQQSQHSER